MKKLFSFLTCSALAAIASAQSPKIIVQGSGAPQVFTDFATAVAAATATDIIYMSGGDFSVGNVPVYIDHEVHIVGAGFHPDSAAHTQPTRINGIINFHLPASNCTVTGIYFTQEVRYGDQNGQNIACAGMLFTRCRVEGGFTGQPAPGSSTTIEQCFLQNDIGGFGAGSTITVRNSIVNGPANSGASILFDHCFLFGNEIGGTFTTLQDCVIARTASASVSDGNYTNCLLYNWTFGVGVVNSGCITSASNPFVDCINFYPLIPLLTDDWHLAAGNPGIGAATDGTDIGLYGGATPLKPGFVPYNPHYLDINIAPATNANGDLPVNITVVRQTN